jgi:sulfopyruvate decarboxylase TPP-binding subunit
MTGIWCCADYIRNVDTSATRHTNISGTCVMIITFNWGVGNSGIMRISIWVTFIIGTFVIIISRYRGSNTSNVMDTFDIGTSINIRTFIFRVFTSNS